MTGYVVCGASSVPHPASPTCEPIVEFDALLAGPPTSAVTIQHRARRVSLARRVAQLLGRAS